ncbi:putative endo-1,3-1,4-beta glucanase [Globisporangium polare]
MSCCPVTALPATHGSSDGVRGFTTTFNETVLYVAAPAPGAVETKVGLLAFPDVFGPESGRIKEDADNLATLGFAVVVVDVTKGVYLPFGDTSGMKEWCVTYNFEDVQRASIQDAIAYLQREYKCETFVSYGYCFGGWVGAHQSALPNPIIKGNISFHPSWGLENLVNGEGAVEKLAERITVPQLLLAASDDQPFVRENGSVIEILSDKPETRVHSSALNFPDVNHGWVTRGDLTKPEIKASVALAWHTALKFIQTVAPQ